MHLNLLASGFSAGIRLQTHYYEEEIKAELYIMLVEVYAGLVPRVYMGCWVLYDLVRFGLRDTTKS